ncbi:MAG TPA: hypothetical protein VNF06_01965 [Candidatus Aquilonibacter sp.]|nr:hypothetical protein [Candidatus Aquilonibacter sp.]
MLNFFRSAKKVTATEMSRPKIKELKRAMLGGGGERQAQFRQLLCSMASDAKLRSRSLVSKVNPRDVGFNMWASDRRERLLRMPKGEFELLLKRKPPSLIGFGLKGGSAVYFVGVDGNHRIAVANELGLKSIPCRVEFYSCLPKRTAILEPVHQRLLKDCKDARPLIIGDHWDGLNIKKRLAAQIVVAMGAREARYL